MRHLLKDIHNLLQCIYFEVGPIVFPVVSLIVLFVLIISAPFWLVGKGLAWILRLKD